MVKLMTAKYKTSGTHLVKHPIFTSLFYLFVFKNKEMEREGIQKKIGTKKK